jgi:hypothetical protein
MAKHEEKCRDKTNTQGAFALGQELEKLHASLRGRGIDVPAEQLIHEDRVR